MIRFGLFCLILLSSSCRNPNLGNRSQMFLPNGFPKFAVPNDNPSSTTGITLGKKLFFDTNLSGDGTVSCSSCHEPQFAFSSSQEFSQGVGGMVGTRNSMPLFNVAWEEFLFWDGRSVGLEEQALGPLLSDLEMASTETQIVSYLNGDESYRSLFEAAFPNDGITLGNVSKALAQYQRSLVSYSSRYDEFLKGNLKLSAIEQDGHDLFFSERAECFHCHPSPMFTDHRFHNNGLSLTDDIGKGAITGQRYDAGLFKTPSLRNLSYTAPYMHDGRFSTLDDVIDFYNHGVVYSSTLDPLMRNGLDLELSDYQKQSLVAFLKTLDDHLFVESHSSAP